MLPLERAHLIEDLGVEGDRKAKPRSSRQVLLMAEENCRRFGVAVGELRENVTVRGIDLQSLPSGTRLALGEAVVEISGDCAPCGFVDTVRPGLQQRIAGNRGMLARVVRTGWVAVGDEVTKR